MSISLSPPPITQDVGELYQWCHRLWDWLQVPERPCFLADNSGVAQSNIATSGSATVAFGNEIFDVGGNFASNTFTAPITGKYLLSTRVRLNDIDSSATYYGLSFNTSNRNLQIALFDPRGLYWGTSGAAYDPAYWNLGGTLVVDMDAGDTASVTVYQSGGTQQTDVDSQGTTTWFSGVLVAR